MRKVNRLIMGLLILLFVVLAMTPLRQRAKDILGDGTVSIASPLSRAGFAVRRTFSFIGAISSLREKNDRLAGTIVNLEVDRSKIQELEHENLLLKKELGFFDSDTSAELVPTRIIGREPTSFLDYVVVDKGKNDGIASGMAVVSSGVLVGQVSEVQDKTSRVTLITSKDSIIQAMLQNSRAKGVLQGGISGLVLENVTQDVEYLPGEYVVTSGLGGELKEGILIGKARESRSPSSGIFKDIAVEPIADFSKLEIVFIAKR